MRALIQRVRSAQVMVADAVVGAIDRGVLVLLGVSTDDTEGDAEWLAGKVAELRIFENDDGRFAYSVQDIAGEVLTVSQFTLYADTRKGRRPSFSAAAPPERAQALYERFVAAIRARGLRAASGQFGARMQVTLTNDGPVTIWLDSRDR